MAHKSLTELRDEMRAVACGEGKALDAAEASHARGLRRSITKESTREFAEEAKSRGRARLAAEQRSR